MRKLFAILLPSFLLFASCEKEDPRPELSCSSGTGSSSSRKELQELLEEYVEKGLPGAVVLVRDHLGTWTAAAGKADLESGTEMRPCHVSKVASITKIMMGTIALQLEEEGKLSLDDRVAEHIPPDRIGDIGNAPQATLRQLMNHRSGIYDVVSDQRFYLRILDRPDREWTADELLKETANGDPYFANGSDEKYSNSNFLLLSLVLGSATGKEHQELLQERIFNPLNMRDSYYDPHDELPDHTASGYYDLYNNGEIVELTPYSTGNGNGYTGVFSTVKDLQRFIEALYRDKTLLDGPTLDRMLTFRGQPQEGKKFGLACYKDFLGRGSDEYAYGHRGRDLAYTAGAYYFPEKDVTLTLLVNYGTNGESHLRPTFREFRDAVADMALD